MGGRESKTHQHGYMYYIGRRSGFGAQELVFIPGNYYILIDVCLFIAVVLTSGSSFIWRQRFVVGVVFEKSRWSEYAYLSRCTLWYCKA